MFAIPFVQVSHLQIPMTTEKYHLMNHLISKNLVRPSNYNKNLQGSFLPQVHSSRPLLFFLSFAIQLHLAAGGLHLQGRISLPLPPQMLTDDSRGLQTHTHTPSQSPAPPGLALHRGTNACPGPAPHNARPAASRWDQARLAQQPIAPASLPRQDVDEHDLPVSQRLTWANY